jgi:hypothetical protein
VKRRHVLAASSAGLAAALWPKWLLEAFADGPACDAPNGGALPRIAALAASYRAAREAGKPLLVFVIPDADMEKWSRGRAFGELLNHGTDVQLAPLSRVEVACAAMADLKKLVPTAGTGEPLMVLVTTDRVPAAVRQLDAELPQYPPPFRFEEHETWEQRDRKEDAISDQRIATMAGLLRNALGADDARAASLAKEVRQKLTIKPPRGVRWAKSYGCGTEVEGEPESLGVACGMGHVPKKSQRFLYFFTKRVL